jgi:hypothetical protein
MLVLAVLATSATLSHSDKPKASAADLIVGAWVPVKDVPGGFFPCEFFADGKLTADGGKAKGTYKVSEVGLHTVVEITLERDGKPLPPEKATIWIRDKDRMVWYPEGEWKGVALNRKK